MTTVFAKSTSNPAGAQGGYGVPNTVVEDDLSRAGDAAVSTGPCAG